MPGRTLRPIGPGSRPQNELAPDTRLAICMRSEGCRVTRVRIFSLDDLAAVEPPRFRGRPAAEEEEGVVMPRRRDETAQRRHAFLDQTLPPINPVVLASERRRSGRDQDGKGEDGEAER